MGLVFPGRLRLERQAAVGSRAGRPAPAHGAHDVPVRQARTIPEFLDLIRQRAKATPEGEQSAPPPISTRPPTGTRFWSSATATTTSSRPTRCAWRASPRTPPYRRAESSAATCSGPRSKTEVEIPQVVRFSARDPADCPDPVGNRAVNGHMSVAERATVLRAAEPSRASSRASALQETGTFGRELLYDEPGQYGQSPCRNLATEVRTGRAPGNNQRGRNAQSREMEVSPWMPMNEDAELWKRHAVPDPWTSESSLPTSGSPRKP